MRRSIRWIIGLCLLVGYVAYTCASFIPALPDPLELDVSVAQGRPGLSEPLIVDGQNGAGNFLYVRWSDPSHFVIAYDCWGAGGPTSAPVSVGAARTVRLQISMAAFAQASSAGRFAMSDHLEVSCNGATLIDANVEHHTPQPGALWIGQNPIGGSSCTPSFAGEISHEGHSLRGPLRALFSRPERIEACLLQCWARFAVAGIILFGIAFYSPDLRSAGRTTIRAIAQHPTFAITTLACCVYFGWLLTGGTFRFVFPDDFGDFFDYQAASLLHGHLDVPREGIGNEAFIFDGKSYGYFGLTPAIQRIPFLLLNIGFGQLTRVLMLADFVGCLVAAYLLLRTTTRILRPDASGPSQASIILFTVNAGAASSLLFLAGRAYVHNETILCGATFGLFAAWCALEHLARANGRWWIGALIFGVLSVQARPPIGLFALSLLGVVAAWHAWQALRQKLRTATEVGSRPVGSFGRNIGIGCLSVIGVFTFNGVSYLKFHTFDGAPVKYNVKFDAARLARIEGKNFLVSNLGYNFDTYFVGPGFLFDRHFPWISPARSVPRSRFPAAKIDYAEGAGALPIAMLPLFLFATVGCAAGAVRNSARRVYVAIVWISGMPMIIAMLMAVASAERYTADFSPFFITAAAVGIVVLDEFAGPIRTLLLRGLSVATLWSAFVMLGLTWQFGWRVVWGVPPETRIRYDRIASHVDHFFGVR